MSETDNAATASLRTNPLVVGEAGACASGESFAAALTGRVASSHEHADQAIDVPGQHLVPAGGTVASTPVRQGAPSNSVERV